MIRGIYAAGAGMIAEGLRTDVTANNLANASTTGFKKEVAVNKEFAELLLWRVNDGSETPSVGGVGAGAAVDAIVTDHSRGAMHSSGGELDVAIEGDGFFVVQTAQGPRYTRNGAFALGPQNQLVTLEGHAVLGQGGRPISLAGASGANRVHITADGVVAVGGREAGRLQVVSFGDSRRLAKEGQNLFAASGGDAPQAAAAKLQQGCLEMSNVNVIQEMVNLISGYRAYEVDAKAIQTQDQMLDKAVNEVGRA